jgi:hypothetical protein
MCEEIFIAGVWRCVPDNNAFRKLSLLVGDAWFLLCIVEASSDTCEGDGTPAPVDGSE